MTTTTCHSNRRTYKIGRVRTDLTTYTVDQLAILWSEYDRRATDYSRNTTARNRAMWAREGVDKELRRRDYSVTAYWHADGTYSFVPLSNTERAEIARAGGAEMLRVRNY